MTSGGGVGLVAPLTLTDASTITWPVSNGVSSSALIDFTVHSGTRTLNVTGMQPGANYTVFATQDSTGGETLTLGTGCTWRWLGGGAVISGALPLTNSANATDTVSWLYDGTNCWTALATAASGSTGLTVGTTSISGGTTQQLLYDTGGALGEITKCNSGVYSTTSGGVPQCSTTLPSGLTIPGPGLPSAILSWGPGTLSDGTCNHQNAVLPQAKLGKPVYVGTPSLPTNVYASASISASGVATLLVCNLSGSSVTVGTSIFTLGASN